ncbi:hypothetical protein BDB01DRAFT_712946 [Pilobolus umbonatus]|nr:hypothetical protein BDB01DRAFT_712946 [Pilobolus umbonatus]
MHWKCRLTAIFLLVNSFFYVANTKNVSIYSVPNFRQPKNIMFTSFCGGSSHVTWVLQILNELHNRGHNITYVAKYPQDTLSGAYPHIKTVVLEGSLLDIIELAKTKYNPSSFEEMFLVYNYMNIPNLKKELVVPYMNFNSPSDDSSFYSLFLRRFYSNIIYPVRSYVGKRKIHNKIKVAWKEEGLPATYTEFMDFSDQNAIKLVNSFLGIEAAQSYGPLFELVGPILPQVYQPLSDTLKGYLDSYSRVLYFAFGQIAVPSEQDIKLLLTAALENIENGVYDALLWSSSNTEEQFSGLITTTSGHTYNISDIFHSKYPNMVFMKWLPQGAVLMHPSVQVFLTHGGGVSLYECLYAGKRIIVFPFFGDQPINGIRVEYNGLGESLKHTDSQDRANQAFEKVGEDELGYYQVNVDRFKSLIQIHSESGVKRGANLVEEVLFSNDKGLLPHRYDHSQYRGFIRPHDIDVYITAFIIAAIPIAGVFYTIRKVYSWLSHTSEAKVQKIE